MGIRLGVRRRRGHLGECNSAEVRMALLHAISASQSAVETRRFGIGTVAEAVDGGFLEARRLLLRSTSVESTYHGGG